MRCIAALIGAITLVFYNNPATAESLSVTSEKFFPGWEDQMMKINAFRGCMIDYGVDFSKWGNEFAAFLERHQLMKVDEWEMGDRLSKYPDFDQRYNKTIKIINEDCYQAANRMNPGIFRIDYNIGGKRGWRTHSALLVSFAECLESDPRFTPDLKVKLLADYRDSSKMRPTLHDLENIRLRKDPLGIDDLSSARKTYGAGTKRCNDKLFSLANMYKLNAQKNKLTKRGERLRIDDQTSMRNQSNSVQDFHKECLEARDYEGCIKVKSGQANTASSDECEPFKWCIADTGTDMLGMPKIKGWGMRSNPSDQSVGYRRPRMQKVNVRGKTNRYIIKEMIIRYYQSPRAAIAGSTTSIGSSSTNCTGYGSTINCTTTPAPTFTSPGIPGRTGGVIQIRSAEIVDCEEMTLGVHVNGQLRGKWKPVAGTNMEKNAAKYCPIRDSLELSTFSKYADN